MVEGARLEIVYTATYRGFESLSLRHCSLSLSKNNECVKIIESSINIFWVRAKRTEATCAKHGNLFFLYQ